MNHKQFIVHAKILNVKRGLDVNTDLEQKVRVYKARDTDK